MLARHYVPSQFSRDRVRITLAGCGGTGSRIMPGLAQIDYALREAFGHQGLAVTVFDGDSVSESNIGRQLFYPADIGKNKADVICTRVNMCYGLDWTSVPLPLNRNTREAIESGKYPSLHSIMQRPRLGNHDADILITAVDSVQARKELVKKEVLRCRYWLDTGNTAKGCQVILGTLSSMPLPRDAAGKLLVPDAVDFLPTVLDLYPNIEEAGRKEYQGPSCSMAAALKRQDLFINHWSAMAACELLWEVFRHPSITHHGKILNLATSVMRPLPVDPEMWARMAGGAAAAEYRKVVALIKRRLTIAAKKKTESAEPVETGTVNAGMKEAA